MAGATALPSPSIRTQLSPTLVAAIPATGRPSSARATSASTASAVSKTVSASYSPPVAIRAIGVGRDAAASLRPPASKATALIELDPISTPTIAGPSAPRASTRTPSLSCIVMSFPRSRTLAKWTVCRPTLPLKSIAEALWRCSIELLRRSADDLLSCLVNALLLNKCTKQCPVWEGRISPENSRSSHDSAPLRRPEPARRTESVPVSASWLTQGRYLHEKAACPGDGAIRRGHRFRSLGRQCQCGGRADALLGGVGPGQRAGRAVQGLHRRVRHRA